MITRLSSRENIWERYGRAIDRASVDISVPQAYGLFRLHHAGPITEAEICRRLNCLPGEIRPKLDAMVASGRVYESPEGLLTLTPAGQDVIHRLSQARLEQLRAKLDGYSPEQHAELLDMLRTLADDSLDAPAQILTD
jgi:DNA-binding MarR family transcriptional regulator